MLTLAAGLKSTICAEGSFSQHQPINERWAQNVSARLTDLMVHKSMAADNYPRHASLRYRPSADLFRTLGMSTLFVTLSTSFPTVSAPDAVLLHIQPEFPTDWRNSRYSANEDLLRN